ncbi:MAG: hypothetical protein WB615_14805 [Candidatus Tumulicola sp.]
MKIRFTAMLGVLFALSIVAAQASPAVESTPAPRPKKPDFAPFSFFIGNWTCTSKMANRPGPATSTATWAMDDTGYWMTSSGDNPPVKWFPYDTKSQSRITYDSDAKLWIYAYSDNVGGYGLYTTPGWKGGTAVWTARSFFPTKETSAVSNYTMKKVSDAKYTGTYSYTNGKGTVVGGQDSCTKA